MKKYIFLILPIFLYASNFSDLIKSVDKNLLVKSKAEQTKALQKMLSAKEAKLYPSLDLHLNTTRLKDIPTTMLHITGFDKPLPMGTRTNINADISITYPLFSGYAITNSIEKAKLQIIKNRLETTDLKRKLYLKIAKLYADIFTVNKEIEAVKDANEAIDQSYKKAKSMYDNGLINISNLYKIEAQKFDISAQLSSLKQIKKSLVNDLYYISGIKMDVIKLPYSEKITNEDQLLKEALSSREDIKILKINLKIDDRDISMIDSKKYPQIFLVGAIKRQGDDFRLNGNGYTNADESYIGAAFSWNVFDGYQRKSEKEAAIYKKNSEILYMQDYERSVTKDLKNAFLSLRSLKITELATSKELRSSKSYYDLTNGRFNNSLASADELSRAIADLAKIKAKLQKIKADIFLRKCSIYLLCGTDMFIKKCI